MSSNVPHHKKIETSTPMFLKSVDDRTPFKFTQFFINHTDSDVFVVFRNNLPIRIKPGFDGYKRSTEFIIRNIYSFKTSGIINDTINNISQVRKAYGKFNEDLQIISDILLDITSKNGFCYNTTSICDICIDRRLSIHDLCAFDNIYDKDTDLMFAYKQLDLSTPHPYSIEGVNISSAVENVSKLRSNYSLTISVIDNENNIDKRYLYAAKEIHEVPVIKDPDRPSGIYVSSTFIDKDLNPHVETKFHNLEDGCKIGIHPTAEQAYNDGDINLVHQKTVAELKENSEKAKYERELEITKLKSENDKVNSEIESLKLKNSVMKDELEMRRMEREERAKYRSQQRTDYYEERSYARKDSSEVMKYAPAFIIGVVSAYGAYSAYSSKKKG